jgi:hypothetical protein
LAAQLVAQEPEPLPCKSLRSSQTDMPEMSPGVHGMFVLVPVVVGVMLGLREVVAEMDGVTTRHAV